jgi:hypothetical protein
MTSPSGEVISRGQAIVAYASKDEASLGLQKLPFERSLGQDIDVDLFVTK